MIDLTELLEERSREAGLPADERLSAVERRIVRRRRRRVAGAGAAALAVVAGFLLPWGSDRAPSTPPVSRPSFGPSSRPPAPGGKVGPFTEYAGGYRVIAVASAPAGTGTARASWLVGDTDVQLFAYCPGASTSSTGDVTVDGTPYVTMGCPSDLRQDPDENPVPVALTPGRTATVSYHLDGPHGKVYLAVAERVPFADFPLPSRPATVKTPTPDGGGTEPGGRVLHSDATNPRKTLTTTMTWSYGHDVSFTILPSTPGIYEVAIDGTTIGRVESYDYRGGGKGWDCRVGKDGSHCFQGLPTIADGQTVTVTFTAQYASGPWLAELRTAPTGSKGHG